MNLIQRAQNIILSPKTEWPVIAEESSNTTELFTNYIAPLAAIPAVATFIGMSVVGFSVPLLGSMKMPIVTGITTMIMQFVAGLIGTYLISLIINALAPQFGAEKSPMQALKLTAYSFTPAWVAGILGILPSLSILVMLASIYSIYVLYLGIPVLMKAPQEKAVGYTAVSIVCSAVVMIVFYAIIGAMSSMVGGQSMYGGMMHGSAGKPAEVSGALGQLEKMGQQMEEANKKMEAAKKSGDPQAEMQAATAALGTVLSGGGSTAEVIDKDKLKALLPEAIANLKRNSIEGEKTAMGEFKISKAEASYADENGHRVHVAITDTGGSKMFGAMYAWGMMEQDKETDTGYEKMGKVDGRPTLERFQKNGPSGEYSQLIAGRFLVETRGDNVDMTTIKSIATAIGYDKLESMKNEGVK